MEIKTKENNKKVFGWKLVAFLYLISFTFGFVWALYNGSYDDASSLMFMCFFNSVPFFSILSLLYGVISAVTMIILKAGKKRFIFSLSTVIVGIIMFSVWYVIASHALNSIS